MADGKVHIGWGLGATSLLGVLAIADQTPESVALVGGCAFSTWLLNPDNDLPSLITHHWLFLEFIWWPYQKITTHRSFHTHVPGWSTFWRCVYLYAWFILPNAFLALHGWHTGYDYTYHQASSALLWEHRTLVLWFFAGLCVNDFMHWFADGFPVKSFFKL